MKADSPEVDPSKFPTQAIIRRERARNWNRDNPERKRTNDRRYREKHREVCIQRVVASKQKAKR